MKNGFKMIINSVDFAEKFTNQRNLFSIYAFNFTKKLWFSNFINNNNKHNKIVSSFEIWNLYFGIKWKLFFFFFFNKWRLNFIFEFIMYESVTSLVGWSQDSRIILDYHFIANGYLGIDLCKRKICMLKILSRSLLFKNHSHTYTHTLS